MKTCFAHNVSCKLVSTTMCYVNWFRAQIRICFFFSHNVAFPYHVIFAAKLHWIRNSIQKVGAKLWQKICGCCRKCSNRNRFLIKYIGIFFSSLEVPRTNPYNNRKNKWAACFNENMRNQQIFPRGKKTKQLRTNTAPNTILI